MEASMVDESTTLLFFPAPTSFKQVTLRFRSRWSSPKTGPSCQQSIDCGKGTIAEQFDVAVTAEQLAVEPSTVRSTWR